MIYREPASYIRTVIMGFIASIPSAIAMSLLIGALSYLNASPLIALIVVFVVLILLIRLSAILWAILTPPLMFRETLIASIIYLVIVALAGGTLPEHAGVIVFFTWLVLCFATSQRMFGGQPKKGKHAD
jgi:hypothetical protein